MPPRPRPSLRSAGRAVLARVPGPVRARVLRVASRRGAVPGAYRGLVSVVVVTEPGDRLAEALASCRAQSHRFLDVVVCPVGSAGTALPDDPRFRALAPVATPSDAVNGGIAVAKGDVVVLLRGCDALLPNAAAALGSSLAASGSDLASGLLTQAGEPESWLRRAQDDAHSRPARALTAPPDLVADLSLATKAFTASFARRVHLTAGDDWLCSPTLAHLLPVATVDVLAQPVVRYAHDRGARAYGARPSPLPLLDAWVRLGDLVAGSLAGTPLAGAWQQHWYDVLLPRFVEDAERADDLVWERLVAMSDVPLGLDLRAGPLSLLALAAAGRRAEVEALAAELDGLGGLDGDLRTEVTGTGLVARWESVDLPEEARRLSDRETRLVAEVVRTRPSRSGREVDLFARVDRVDQAEHPLELTVTGGNRDLSVRTRPDHAADRWAHARFQSAAEGAVTVEVPVRAETLRLRATTAGLVREAKVTLPIESWSAPSPPAVTGIRLYGDRLVVQLDEPADDLRLRGAGVDVPGEPQPDGSLVFDTRHDLFGRPTWLPTGRYHLHRERGLGAAPDWRAALPREQVGDRHRLRVVPDGSGPGALLLGPPRADRELGAHGQERLRASYAADPRPTDPGLWYLEAFAGRSATDTPLAAFAEARRRHPENTMVWAVSDHGQWTPEGAVPVVIGTSAWYDALATAGVLVITTELEGWYRRRPDQVVVQCFHGYPAKAMGESQWRARDLPPRRLAVMRRRSVETWDLISTPTPEMTEVYRAQYGYTGPAAEHGYPRDDALTGPGADEVRRTTRRLLGIGEEQTAVLYAPTWRDHLATRPRGAEMTDFLDLDAAAEALGDSHVLLLRGHRFHAAGGSRRGVVDVTDHPEVNDLVLASDVAVLDYSSLRFDYAVTGKPMVFLVPDLDDYTGGVRGFLLPFEETAPGPLVATTAQVVAEVRDVAGLATTWSDRVAAFDARYNPWQDGHATERFVDVVDDLLAGRLPTQGD